MESVGEGVDDGSSDAKTGKGTGTGHKGDFVDILPCFMFGGQFFVNETKEFFGKRIAEFVLVLCVI